MNIILGIVLTIMFAPLLFILILPITGIVEMLLGIRGGPCVRACDDFLRANGLR